MEAKQQGNEAVETTEPSKAEPKKEAPQQEVHKGDSVPNEAARKKSPWGLAIHLELKLLAIDALGAGLSPTEVGELFGLWPWTVCWWRQLHAEGGMDALRRSASSPQLNRRCKEIEERMT